MHANIAKLITEVKEQIQSQDSARNDDRSQKYWNKQDPNLYKVPLWKLRKNISFMNTLWYLATLIYSTRWYIA